FRSVDSRMFEADAKQLGTQVDLRAWLYQGGLPANAAATPSTRATEIEQRAKSGADPDASGGTTRAGDVFLRTLPETITAERLQALDARYQLTNTTNAEIAMHWLPLLVRADVRDAAPAVEAFLLKVGRVRMVRPLYAAMMAGSDPWRALAKA